MKVTMEYVHILDKSEHLAQMILQSECMKVYEDTYNTLKNDKKAQELINAFTKIKSHYEDVQRFGRYHPDYNEIMKNVRAAKRKMDMNEHVANFKVAERNLQQLLDEISEYIAKSVSEHILVPKGDGGLTSCTSGSCGSGGKCGCQAS